MLSSGRRVDLVEGEHLLFGVVGRGRYGRSRRTRTGGRSGIHADSGVRGGIDDITLEAGWNGSKVVLIGRANAESWGGVNWTRVGMRCWTRDSPTCTEVEAALDGCDGAMVKGRVRRREHRASRTSCVWRKR